MTSDNGSQFTSAEYRTYLYQHGIRPRVFTPYWPSANGEVERFNRTLGKAIQTAHTEGKDWRKELPGFLLQYRTTPHSTTGIAPAEALFKTNIRNGVPDISNSTTDRQKQLQRKDKEAENESIRR